MKLRTVLVSAAIILSVLAAAGVLGFVKYKQITKGMAEGANRPEPAETVELIQAEAGPFQRTATAVGSIQAIRHVMLASEVSGKVVEVNFTSGQIVQEGTLLVRLDSATEQADKRAAEATRDLARVMLSRMQEAASANAVSKQETDRAKAELDSGSARVDQFQAMIDKKTIRAPFTGRMGLRDIHPGQYLAEGQKITTLQGIDDEVYVDFSVPQLQAVLLPVGASVTVVIADKTFPARVTAIDAQIEQATRNARIRATMSSLGGRLIPGAFVDVRIPLGPPVDVVKIPPTAVRRAPFGDHVFVVKADPKDNTKLRAHQQFITTAGSVDGKVIIASGLAPGDRIAGDGSFKLREGVLVIPAPPAGAPGDQGPQSAPGAPESTKAASSEQGG